MSATSKNSVVSVEQLGEDNVHPHAVDDRKDAHSKSSEFPFLSIPWKAFSNKWTWKSIAAFWILSAFFSFVPSVKAHWHGKGEAKRQAALQVERARKTEILVEPGQKSPKFRADIFDTWPAKGLKVMYNGKGPLYDWEPGVTLTIPPYAVFVEIYATNEPVKVVGELYK
jgi:hypothetical protein